MAVKLVVIGGGNMAQAIVRGGVDAGTLQAREVLVVEPDPAKRARFESRQVRATDRHAEALAELPVDRGVILLAVKPQVLREVADQVRHHPPGAGRLVISILAGTTTHSVSQALGGAAVVRAMPNTAARIRQSITAISAGEHAREGDIAETERLLGALGPTVRIDESLMDAFTALAGSGPAYLFYLAEAMAAAAVGIGFDAQTADRVTRQTLLGAASLLAGGDQESPGALRAAVTSKGGTTEAAIKVLDERRVTQAVVDAITRARDRGRELGGS
jgi:pyrroline-5-carboxylate reductase